METFKLFTDGGSRGNPGDAGLGFVLEGDAARVTGGWYLGSATNNVAEYSALIWGLRNALDLGVSDLAVCADSELMIKQLNGEYKVKNEGLRPLFQQAKELASRFISITFSHVYRENNAEADALANEAMDAHSSVGSFRVPFEEQPLSLFDMNIDAAAEETLYEAPSDLAPTFISEGDPMIERNTTPLEANALSGKTFEDEGGVYCLTVRDHFDAAHTLPGYQGPCRYLHGHTWDVEVSIEGQQLDEVGIIYDFKDIKNDLAGILENFDHRYINDTPPFVAISPTAENLARVIFHELKTKLPQTITLKEVAIWESPQARVSYRP